MPRSIDGILLVDKSAGLTSAEVVRRVKKRLDVAKIGHLGTLDPFATGLLPLCLGEGSKVVPFLNQEEKEYEAVLRLGSATDTLDVTGETVETAAVPPLDAGELAALADRFVGEIEQVPPMYSALKRRGVRLHRLARSGVEVEREPRRVTVRSLSLERLSPDEIRLDVRCSKGTYVRVLAADLARALGTVGHLTALRRTVFGRFAVGDALPLDDLAADGPLPLLDPRASLADLRELDVDDALEARLRSGQQWTLERLPGPRGGERIAKVVGRDGSLVAIVGADGRGWKIMRVFRRPTG